MLANRALAILFLLIPTVLSSVCEDFVSRQEQRKFYNDYSNLTPEETAFNDFSGSETVTIDFGNQDLCLATPDMYYFVTVYRYQIEAGYLQPTFHEHGVCLPQSCSMLLHTTNDPLLLRIYSVKSYNQYSGPPLVNVNIELYDPAQNIKSKPVMFYITCIFILLFVFLCFVSTIVLHYRSRKMAFIDIESSQRKQQNRFDWLLKSCDIKENLINLYQTAAEQKQNQHIAIFQFLRIITSYWVIYFHVTGIIITPVRRIDKPKTQPELDYFSSYLYDLQRAGNLTVEYFFMMTGFLGAYTLVPKLSKEKFKIMTYLNIIKHRILRVRLLYIVAFLVFWQVTPFLTTGPRWYVTELNSMVCDNIWWRNILMIDNFMNLLDLSKNEGYCFLYGWYLSAEFQIYLVAILVFAVFAKYRRIGYLLVIALILQSFVLALITHFNLKIDYYAYTPQTFIWAFLKHKYMPYARWYTLFIGALWGLLYYEYSKLNKKNIFWIFETKPLISYLTMICGAVLNLYVVFTQFHRKPENMTEGERYSWEALRILLITVSITMIFMPLVSNRQFYLKSFLNLRIFQILGKTSYAVYLFQVDFLYLVEYTSTAMFPFSYGRLVLESVKVIAATQAFGFLAHIFLEKPMLNIEAHLSKPKQEKKSIAKDLNAKIEIELKSERPQEEQSPLPEHVRPVELETGSSGEKEEKERVICPSSVGEDALPPAGNNKQEQYLILK